MQQKSEWCSSGIFGYAGRAGGLIRTMCSSASLVLASPFALFPVFTRETISPAVLLERKLGAAQAACHGGSMMIWMSGAVV